MGRAPALSRSTFAVRGVNAFWKEITIGLRLLSKAPRLTAGVVLILAIGIASNTVIFSVAHGIFLRPLSYPDIVASCTFLRPIPVSPRVEASSGYPTYRDVL